MDTNLTGMILGTRFLLRKKYISGSMKEDVSPVVINVASLLGLKGGIGAVAYAASKAGVIGFTRALSEELGKSCIRVNALVPGYVATDMTAGRQVLKSSRYQLLIIYNARINRVRDSDEQDSRG